MSISFSAPGGHNPLREAVRAALPACLAAVAAGGVAAQSGTGLALSLNPPGAS